MINNLQPQTPYHTLNEKLFAWARIVRLPNTFTVVADVWAGAIYASAARFETPWIDAVIVALSSIGIVAMYWLGMIWNDLNDFEFDTAQERNRPLVTKHIQHVHAQFASIVLMIISIVCAVSISTIRWNRQPLLQTHSSLSYFAPVAISLLLLAAIRAYNSHLKLTFLGPVLMGVCRGLAILFGVAAGTTLVGSASDFAIWSELSTWLLFIGQTVYVAGFTLAASKETFVNKRSTLIVGWGISIIGLVILGSVPVAAAPNHFQHLPPATYCVGCFIVSLPLLRSIARSIRAPIPQTIQPAIKHAIFSIILIDALLALQFGGRYAGIAVCLLIVPAIFVGRKFAST